MLKDSTFGLITSFATKGGFVFPYGFCKVSGHCFRSSGSLGSWCVTVPNGQACPYSGGIL